MRRNRKDNHITGNNDKSSSPATSLMKKSKSISISPSTSSLPPVLKSSMTDATTPKRTTSTPIQNPFTTPKGLTTVVKTSYSIGGQDAFVSPSSSSSLSSLTSLSPPSTLIGLKRNLFFAPSNSRKIPIYTFVGIGFLIVTIINSFFMLSHLDGHLQNNMIKLSLTKTATATATTTASATSATSATSNRLSRLSSLSLEFSPRKLRERKKGDNVLPFQSNVVDLSNEKQRQRQFLVEHVPDLLHTLDSIISSTRNTASSSKSQSSSSNNNNNNNNNTNNNYIERSNVIRRKIPPNSKSIALVTQGHISKFTRLLALVERWRGPISCAMYITSYEELYTFYNYVLENQSRRKDEEATLFEKYVSIHLLFEAAGPVSRSRSSSSSSPSKEKVFYPINLLRNLALHNAKNESDYVFLNDIDLIPPTQSHSSLLTTILEQHKQQNISSSMSNRTIWVLPAFERFSSLNDITDVTDVNEILSLVPNDKASLHEALQNEDVAPFHAYSPAEHGLTDYARWYNETQIYDIEYGFNFEPYGVMASRDVHDFYPLFRGYGGNKLTFYLEAHIRGYNFRVLPNHFVVHLDHEFRDKRDVHKDGNKYQIFPRFQEYLQDRYGIPKMETTIAKLSKAEYGHRDTDIRTTKFPCHYLMQRDDEFKIIPNFNKLQHLNSLVKRLPMTTDDKYDVTIITMMHPSTSMFNQLKEMSTNWSGQISVAVFIDNDDPSTVSKTKSEIKKFQSKNKADFGSRFAFHLVIDRVGNRGKDVNVFPRNLLRNVALNYAQTEHVMVLDMDLTPSSMSHENLKRHLKTLDEDDSIEKKSPFALVIPAFEKSSKYGKNVTVATKSALMERMKQNPEVFRVFLIKDKVQAHNATDYDRWYATDHDLYDVTYQVDYEPYVVVRKDANLPPFWEHFTGFGRNKLEWIEELYLSGFQFKVVPDSFVVHRNHKKYGLRNVRPYVVDEYSWRFLSYLEEIYGRSLQDFSKLGEWSTRMYTKWQEKVTEEEKTEQVSWEHMAKMSERRDKEFASCLNLIKSR